MNPNFDHQLPKSSCSQQQDEERQDFDAFLSCLPRERGWRTRYLYKHQGFWHEPNFLRALLACQQHFQAQDSDIFVATFPKSGTTWLKALTFTLANRKRYPLDNNHPLLSKNPHQLLPYLEIDLYLDYHHNNDNKTDPFDKYFSTSSPRLLSTHLPFASLPKSLLESKCKIVYLCRDIEDTFASFWHFSLKTRKDESMEDLTLEEAFDLFAKGVSPYGPVWDHVLEYWKASVQHPNKILFMRYEEMKEQPLVQVKRLADFLDFPFNEEEEASGLAQEISRFCSFENMSNLEVNKNGKFKEFGNNLFFRRGQVGDAKNLLSEDMLNQLHSLTKHKFHGSGIHIFNH